MANQNSVLAYLEGSSANRPPLLNGTNYIFWKNRIRTNTCSINFYLWNIVGKGPHILCKLFSDGKIPKKLDEYDEDDSKKMTLNFRAMNILCCALDETNYN